MDPFLHDSRLLMYWEDLAHDGICVVFLISSSCLYIYIYIYINTDIASLS